VKATAEKVPQACSRFHFLYRRKCLRRCSPTRTRKTVQWRRTSGIGLS